MENLYRISDDKLADPALCLIIKSYSIKLNIHFVILYDVFFIVLKYCYFE